MAYLATNVFDADGVKTYWDFSFAGVSPDSDSGTTPYLYAADVKALELYRDIDGNAAAAERIVTINPLLPNRAVINGPAIAAGRQVKIYRSTEIRFPLVDYRDRQSVSERDLDLANRQAIFVAQETQDAASNNMALDRNDNYDVKLRRIVNLSPGVDLGDAVNMNQFLHTVRVPATDAVLPALPTVSARAGKLLSFDASGNPIASFPPAGTALDLEMQLIDKVNPLQGAAKIGYKGRALNEYLDAQPSILSYAGPTTQAIITAALVALNANGGGTITVPAAQWQFSGTVAATLTTSVVIEFLGGKLTQTVDAHMFDLTLSGGGSINFSGSIDIGCSFSGRSVSAAIVHATGSGKLRDFVISGIMRYRAGGAESQFKYGVFGEGLQDPDARGLLLYGVDGRTNFHSIGMRLTGGVGQASTSWKVWGPSTYNTKKGIEFYSASYPGVEGIKIMAGDFVSCENGITCDASASGYVPPQFELVSCHVNSYGKCLELNGILNVKLIGGLLYRQGAGTTDPFVDITDCQDIALIGTTMHCITAGLDIGGVVARGVARPVAFMRVDSCHFWLNGPTKPCVQLIGDVAQFKLSGTNTRSAANPWLDITGVTSGKSGITLAADLIYSANDPVRTSVTPAAGVLDLRESLTTNILLAGVTSGTVITSILGRKGWRYDIRSDVAGVAYTPSSAIQIAGATANWAYYIAGGFFTFFMDGDTAARYVGGSMTKSLRAPIMPVQMSTHASGALPAASINGGAIIMVTGVETYTIPAFSEGTNWRRLDTFAIVT